MKRSLSVLAVILGFAMVGAGTSGYKAGKKVPLEGTGGWDYLTVDEAGRRLYVAHATQVLVYDADSLELVGKIAGLGGVHGVAVVPEVNRGFITAAASDSVVIFDLKTLKRIGDVKVGKKPDAIIYDPATKRVFAMNGDGDSATAINAADSTVAGTVQLGGGPEFPAVDGKGNLFVNLEESSEILQIDTKAMTVKNRWPVAPCQAPSSLAMDTDNHRLFLGCRSKVMAVVDAQSGKVITTYPIGDHVDASFYDAGSKSVMSSTGDGNIYIFHQDSSDAYTLIDTVPTAAGSKTMGFDPKTKRVYVPARDGGSLSLWTFDKQ